MLYFFEKCSHYFDFCSRNTENVFHTYENGSRLNETEKLYILINDKEHSSVWESASNRGRGFDSHCSILLIKRRCQMAELEYWNIREVCEICDNVLSVERHDPSDPLEGFFCHKCKKWVCVDCTCFVESDAYSACCKDCCDCYDELKSNEVKAEDFFCYNDENMMNYAKFLSKYGFVALAVSIIVLSLSLYFVFR